VGALLLYLLVFFLGACDFGQSSHRQTVQTDNGATISYSTQPQDVVVRLFFGGGKVGSLQLTPQVSLYGDGTFIMGSGLQLQKGLLSNNDLQNLLQTLINVDNLLNLQPQVFDDIPNQNTTLLQIMLNDKDYQFIYGPFGHLGESTQEMQAYKQLGNAISTIRNALTGPETSYTSQDKALLVYQTSRIDFTYVQRESILEWTVDDISLLDVATYECGLIQIDPNNPRPNLDNGCLIYTVPLFAVQPDQQDLQLITALLGGQQQGMFQEDKDYYVVTLRPLLPDEMAYRRLAMYGSNTQQYTPIPLTDVPTPTPTVTP
jgi:hypothetical protein